MKDYFLIFFSCFSLLIFGQKQQDSLEIELWQKVDDATNDSLKVHYLIELIKKIEKYDIDRGRKLVHETIRLIDSTKMQQNTGLL